MMRRGHKGFSAAAAATALMAGFLVIPFLVMPAAASPRGSTEAVPIPGGLDIPPLIHVFAPGPTSLGDQGLDVEPATLTNYNGFTAQGYTGGTATTGSGQTLNMMTDMRLYRGEYVSSDGTRHHGTFVFT